MREIFLKVKNPETDVYHLRFDFDGKESKTKVNVTVGYDDILYMFDVLFEYIQKEDIKEFIEAYEVCEK